MLPVDMNHLISYPHITFFLLSDRGRKGKSLLRETKVCNIGTGFTFFFLL